MFAIDATAVAAAAGVGKRVNTVLQACFFALSGVLPRDAAIAAIKRAAKKTYGVKGDEVVAANFAAIDAALDGPARGRRSATPARPSARRRSRARRRRRHVRLRPRRHAADDRRHAATSCRSRRCRPTARSRSARRSTRSATSPTRFRSGTRALCIQCNKCTFVCPHAAIRVKAIDPSLAGRARRRRSRRSTTAAHEFEGMKYTIQVAPEDCTGCDLCVQVCPAKDKVTGVKALVMSRAAAAARAGAGELRVLPGRCPRPDRTPDEGRARSRGRSSCSRSSSSPARAPAAARRRT